MKKLTDPTKTPVSKEHAFDVIHCLSSNMHEGFHGSMFEMSDALSAFDPEVFDKQVSLARQDPGVVEDAKWWASEDYKINEEEYNRYFQHHVAGLMYRYVVSQMIDVVIDQTASQVTGGAFGHIIRSDELGGSHRLLKSIMDDMILCIENDDDDTIVATPFNREFFYGRAPAELKDIPDPDPLTLSNLIDQGGAY